VSLPFLLEIGSEEIPAWMIPPALDNLRDLFTKVLEEHRLGGTVVHVDATPRRLVLCAEGLAERQADTNELVSGAQGGRRGRDRRLRPKDGSIAGSTRNREHPKG
jgi:glycyl-tRNA synthetase beta chain